MKKILYYSAIIILIILGCKSLSKDSIQLVLTLDARSNSKTTGTAIFTEKNGIVTLEAKLTGMQPGIHAIHIHEKADCTSADATSAGGHWNPTFKKHGKWGEGEYHKGDIGNMVANEEGNGIIKFKTDEWCIGCGDPTKDILGKGLIVHDKPDDFTTQPTGNAGARIACSAIIR